MQFLHLLKTNVFFHCTPDQNVSFGNLYKIFVDLLLVGMLCSFVKHTSVAACKLRHM